MRNLGTYSGIYPQKSHSSRAEFRFMVSKTPFTRPILWFFPEFLVFRDTSNNDKWARRKTENRFSRPLCGEFALIGKLGESFFAVFCHKLEKVLFCFPQRFIPERHRKCVINILYADSPQVAWCWTRREKENMGGICFLAETNNKMSSGVRFLHDRHKKKPCEQLLEDSPQEMWNTPSNSN